MSISEFITILHYIATGQTERLSQSEWKAKAQDALLTIDNDVRAMEGDLEKGEG